MTEKLSSDLVSLLITGSTREHKVGDVGRPTVSSLDDVFHRGEVEREPGVAIPACRRDPGVLWSLSKTVSDGDESYDALSSRDIESDSLLFFWVFERGHRSSYGNPAH